MVKCDTELAEYIKKLFKESYERENERIDADEETAASKKDIYDRIHADLAKEQKQALDAALYLDDHPEEREPDTEAAADQAVVKREMLKTAIARIENAARTVGDFMDVAKKWDILERNEERRLRNHEILRGDVPLDYGRVMDGAIFPAFFMEPKWKQLMRGSYIALIYDCPFEMDELTADIAISRLMRSLRDDHKEIFYWHFIRQLPCAEVGRIRGQTDRNIRKTRGVILRKLQKELAAILKKREQAGCHLTLRQRAFLERIEKDMLDGQSVSR